VVPDARRTLASLADQWRSCTDCELGIRRASYDHFKFVVGEGIRRGIMLIGDGPAERDELTGRPFQSDAGQIIRRILEQLGNPPAYLTNVTACRSASHRTDGEGQPLFTRTKTPLPVWKDEPLQMGHATACRTRIEEEIYLVDPVVIVVLGQTAAESLLRRKVRIQTSGMNQPERLTIPGVFSRAVLTEKKQAWFRKQEGKWVAPTEQGEVAYYALPTIRPDWARRKLADRGPDNAFRRLFSDIRSAVRVYEQHQFMLTGVVPSGGSDATFEALQAALATEKES
jgi:uracil-DNA glycosylase